MPPQVPLGGMPGRPTQKSINACGCDLHVIYVAYFGDVQRRAQSKQAALLAALAAGPSGSFLPPSE